MVTWKQNILVKDLSHDHERGQQHSITNNKPSKKTQKHIYQEKHTATTWHLCMDHKQTTDSEHEQYALQQPYTGQRSKKKG